MTKLYFNETLLPRKVFEYFPLYLSFHFSEFETLQICCQELIGQLLSLVPLTQAAMTYVSNARYNWPLFMSQRFMQVYIFGLGRLLVWEDCLRCVEEKLVNFCFFSHNFFQCFKMISRPLNIFGMIYDFILPDL